MEPSQDEAQIRNEGRNLALNTLNQIQDILKKMTKDKEGKWVLTETFAPSQMFANSDKQRFGININKYTPGCVLLTDRLFLAEDTDSLIKATVFEKPLHECMMGGGLSYQLHLGGKISSEQLRQVLIELLSQGIPVFKLVLE